jgi:hypothetical protein
MARVHLHAATAVLLIVALATPLASQEAAVPTGLETHVLRPGDPTPVAMRAVAIGAGLPTCGLPKLLEQVTTNPGRVRVEDPFMAGFTDCEVALPPLPPGEGYVAAAMFTGTCRDAQNLPFVCIGASGFSVPFGVVAQQLPCDPDASGRRPVTLAVGDWTRSAPRGGLGRVLFSLSQSTRPVTTVITRLNDIERDRVEGSDLRKVAGAYIQLPTVKGTYQISVEARDALGCSDGVNRPMTVLVQ